MRLTVHDGITIETAANCMSVHSSHIFLIVNVWYHSSMNGPRYLLTYSIGNQILLVVEVQRSSNTARRYVHLVYWLIQDTSARETQTGARRLQNWRNSEANEQSDWERERERERKKERECVCKSMSISESVVLVDDLWLLLFHDVLHRKLCSDDSNCENKSILKSAVYTADFIIDL